ncbi:MAG: LysR family transcriptional regulator [Peptococcaceae bacterium]
MGIDLDYIREFIILSKILNFSKTAEMLHMTQPTLSRHLICLEEEVGTCLVRRTKRNVRLTTSGKVFLEKAIGMVAQYDDAVKAIKQLDITHKRQLGLGLLYYQKEFFLEKIELFKHKYPDIILNFVAATPNELLKELLDRNIDVCATMHIDFKNVELLKFVDLYTEPLIMMTSSKHALSNRKSIQAKDLAKEVFVNVDDDFYRGYFEYIKLLFKSNGVNIANPILVSNYEMMLLAVQSGVGIAILTTNMKRHLTNCAILEIENDNFVITRSLAYRSDNTNNATQLFLRLFS